jgi:hypothetical protein
VAKQPPGTARPGHRLCRSAPGGRSRCPSARPCTGIIIMAHSASAGHHHVAREPADVAVEHSGTSHRLDQEHSEHLDIIPTIRSSTSVKNSSDSVFCHSRTATSPAKLVALIEPADYVGRQGCLGGPPDPVRPAQKSGKRARRNLTRFPGVLATRTAIAMCICYEVVQSDGIQVDHQVCIQRVS